MEVQDLSLYVAVLLLLCGIYFWNRRRKLNLPPGPVCLPIVGYLPFLGKEPFKTLDDLGKTYGNIFSLYLGRNFFVVLNDIDAIKEAYLGPSILSRPPEFWSFLPDSLGFGALNGSKWSEQRRFTLRMLRNLGFGKSNWEQLVKEEIDDLIQVLESHEGHAVDVVELLGSCTTSNIWSLTFGKRLPVGDPTRKKIDYLIDAVPRHFAPTALHTIIPTLTTIFVKLNIFGYKQAHKDTVALNNLVRNEVSKRKAKLDEEHEDVYADEYLKEMKNLENCNRETSFSEKLLRGNIQVLLIGGSDTTKTSIHWLLLAMAANPETQMKVHEELDGFLGRDGYALWSQRNELPYTHAAILEGQRWRTVGPLSLTRIASEDTKVGGYDIPKGTMIIADLWSIHNDKRYWSEPEKFSPERFLDESDNKLIVKPESYIPFSIGRRSCPAENIALIEIFFYFTSIMLKFEIFPSTADKPLNLEGTTGVMYTPVEEKLRFLARY